MSSSSLVRFLKTFIPLTLVNVFITWFFSWNLYIFGYRQLFIVLLSCFYLFSSPNILYKEYIEEKKYIEDTVHGISPILRYQPLMAFFSFSSIYVVIYIVDKPELYMFGFLIVQVWLGYLYMVALRVTIIFGNPELRKYYSPAFHFDASGKRHFSTFFKTVAHNKDLVLPVVAGVFIGSEATPRLIQGDIDARGPLLNALSGWTEGFKARTNTEIRDAMRLVSLYPDSRSLIVRDDGLTIDTYKLSQEMAKRKLESSYLFGIGTPKVDINVDYGVKTPKFSLKFWEKK